jgi:hypothetical protein
MPAGPEPVCTKSRSASGTYQFDQSALLAEAFIVLEEALRAVPALLCHGTHRPNMALLQGVLR